MIKNRGNIGIKQIKHDLTCTLKDFVIVNKEFNALSAFADKVFVVCINAPLHDKTIPRLAKFFMISKELLLLNQLYSSFGLGQSPKATVMIQISENWLAA